MAAQIPTPRSARLWNQPIYLRIGWILLLSVGLFPVLAPMADLAGVATSGLPSDHMAAFASLAGTTWAMDLTPLLHRDQPLLPPLRRLLGRTGAYGRRGGRYKRGVSRDPSLQVRGFTRSFCRFSRDHFCGVPDDP